MGSIKEAGRHNRYNTTPRHRKLAGLFFAGKMAGMRLPWMENGYLQIPTGKGFYMGIPLWMAALALAIVVSLPIIAAVLMAALSSKRRVTNK